MIEMIDWKGRRARRGFNGQIH